MSIGHIHDLQCHQVGMALVQLAEEIIRRYGDHAPRLKSSGIDACGMKLVAKLLQRGTTRPCPRGREPLHILEKQPAMSADLVERHGTIVQQSGQELPGHAKEVRGSLGRHRLLARDHEDGPASLEVAGDHHDEREQLLRQRDLPAFGVDETGLLAPGGREAGDADEFLERTLVFGRFHSGRGVHVRR